MQKPSWHGSLRVPFLEFFSQTYFACFCRAFLFADAPVLFRKKKPVLTLSQARMLLIASFSDCIEEINRTISTVNYYIKRYVTSFRSYCKTAENSASVLMVY